MTSGPRPEVAGGVRSEGGIAAGAIATIPGLIAVAVFLVWAAADGGYPPTTWYPGGLVLLALLAVTAVAYRPLAVAIPRETVASLGFLAAFVVWSFLTILWAGVKGDAWDGANRTFLYLVVYCLFALLPWRSVGAALTIGVFALGIALVGGVAFFQAVGSDDPANAFIGGRFAEPVGYMNANGALCLMAFWPAVFLAGRRETPLPLRGIFLAAAGLLLELALLPQSRGSLFAFPIVALLYLALVPGRVRSALSLAAVAAAVFAARGPLLDVYSAVEGPRGPEVLADAKAAIAWSLVALFVAGTAIAVVDRLLRVPDPWPQRISLALGAVAVVAVIVVAGALVSKYGNPITRADRAWTEFKAGQTQNFGASRFTGGLGSNRYDFWRVGMGEFRDAPVHGVGADNFAVAYLRERRSGEEPLYPHSLEIQILSQTGIVGALLFGAFTVSVLAAAARARSVRRSFGRALAATSVIVFAYWFVHGSVDWFWEFPALAAPAFAFLGLAAGLGRAPRSHRPRRTKVARLGLVAGAAVVGLLGVASLALPWAAAAEVEHAAPQWRTDPDAAFERLRLARRLNFLSDRPDLIAGAIAMRLDDLSRAEDAFSAALERNRDNWYARLELGIIASLQGKRAQALANLRGAEVLNPREPIVDDVIRRVRTGKRVSPRAVDRIFLQRLEELTD
jgi:hypothetical protein